MEDENEKKYTPKIRHNGQWIELIEIELPPGYEAIFKLRGKYWGLPISDE